MSGTRCSRPRRTSRSSSCPCTTTSRRWPERSSRRGCRRSSPRPFGPAGGPPASRIFPPRSAPAASSETGAHMMIEVLPKDAYNAELVANVHPPGWRPPDPAPRYNLVVIGGGTAGLVTAAGAAGLGARVALIERLLLGGDCLNVGCVPSKAVIRSSRVVGDIRAAAALGVRVTGTVDPDFGAVMERMRGVRARISHHDSAERFTGLGVDVFLGDGRFTGPDTVEVNGTPLRFKKAVIAAGTRARHPDVPGLRDAGFLTNENVFELIERPRRLAVIGAGPIGCELAQAFRRLGSEVTLFHTGGHILNREDADAAGIVQRAFVDEGIHLVLDARLTRVERSADGKVLHCETPRGPARVVIQNALFMGRKTLAALTIPWCTYTDPEIAHVGLYGRDAEKRGIAIDTYLRPFSEVDRAVADREEDGFVKVHVRKGGDRIVGATIVARHAGEMINELTLAMTAGVGLGRLASVIHPYPTQAEAIRQLGDMFNRTRLTPTVKKLFGAWLRWTR